MQRQEQLKHEPPYGSAGIQIVPEPSTDQRLLSPVERISEMLFGLIMALTFTCTIRISVAEQTEVRHMLIGALGCNIAWGIVDAVMYLLMTLTERGHGRMMFNFVRKAKDVGKTHTFIAEVLPPVIASVLKSNDLEMIRQRLLLLPEQTVTGGITRKDAKIALGIFIIVILSTFPVVIPFFFVRDVQTALRTSNAVAIVMMFMCGWMLGRYSGRNRMVMGLMMSLIGIMLVFIAISLGG